MTPKEKAKELVERFRPYVDNTGDDLYYSKEVETERAKQCALICVDEIIKLMEYLAEYRDRKTGDSLFMFWDKKTPDQYHYWQQAKQEIEKL